MELSCISCVCAIQEVNNDGTITSTVMKRIRFEHELYEMEPALSVGGIISTKVLVLPQHPKLKRRAYDHPPSSAVISVTQVPSGEERFRLARPSFSAIPSREADQARSSNAEGVDAHFESPNTYSYINALRT